MIGTLLARQRVPAGIDPLNRKDLDDYLKHWVDNALLLDPGQIQVESGTYDWKDAIQEIYRRDIGLVLQLSITLTYIRVAATFDFTGNNTIFVEGKPRPRTGMDFAFRTMGSVL